jgi:hypothetical protein
VLAFCPPWQPLQEIEQQLLDSIAAVQDYQKGHPHVFNLNKLTRRIRSDLLYIRHLTTQPLQELTQSRLQVSRLCSRNHFIFVRRSGNQPCRFDAAVASLSPPYPHVSGPLVQVYHQSTTPYSRRRLSSIAAGMLEQPTRLQGAHVLWCLLLLLLRLLRLLWPANSVQPGLVLAWLGQCAVRSAADDDDVW